LPAGAPVYCSSSQAVKRRFRHGRPKAGLFRVRHSIDVAVECSQQQCVFHVRLGDAPTGQTPLQIERDLHGSFEPAKDPAAMEKTARAAFDKLGDTPFTLRSFAWNNPAGVFIPVSRLNQVRRELIAELEQALRREHAQRLEQLRAEVCPQACPRPFVEAFAWSVKVDRIGFLDTFDPGDWAGVDEVIVDITRDHPTQLCDQLESLASLIGRDRIRLALPALTRKWEENSLGRKVDKLRSAGWDRWEAANLSAWNYLGLDPARGDTGPIDLATDWSIYTLNRWAARQLLDMGVRRFALSPEDGLQNMRSLLAEFGAQAVVIVHQDTPQFIAESCAYANLIGGCPGKANCRFESMDMVSSHGERVTALDYHCRTIVLNQGPFCLSTRLRDLATAGARLLRADFIYRNYEPDEVRRIWRAVRGGQAVRGGHAANFDRGIL
jgi:putative protease